MGVTIRPMTVADAESVSAILEGCYRHLAVTEGFSATQLEGLLVERCTPGHVREGWLPRWDCHVAERGGAVVGALAIAGSDIAELFVSPDCHRHGIGTALFRTAEARIAEAGHRSLTLRCAARGADPFYTAMGMQVVECRPCPFGPLEGWPLTCYRSEVASSVDAESTPTGVDSLRQEWNELAPAWIRETREGSNPTRNGLLDPLMLQACGDVTGLRILDCGCGEGRFCRAVAARGADHALGVDLCEPMIAAARALQSEHDEYRVGDVQDMPFLGDATFDIAVSYLNQCDLPDFEANNREVYRILRPGGRFIVANLHPMRSAVGGWHRTADGEKQHVILDRYFDESPRHWKMLSVEFTNFHRTLATYVHAFRDAGFRIEDLIEPTVTPTQLEDYPELDDEVRVPNFIIYVLTKPGEIHD